MGTPVKLGDALEIAGFFFAALAAYLYWNAASAFLVVAVALIYEGQCFTATPIPDLKPRQWARGKLAAARRPAKTHE